MVFPPEAVLMLVTLPRRPLYYARRRQKENYAILSCHQTRSAWRADEPGFEKVNLSDGQGTWRPVAPVIALARRLATPGILVKKDCFHLPKYLILRPG